MTARGFPEELMAGARGEGERRSRRRLLHSLTQAGVPERDLRHAVDQDRLALLPTELTLVGRERYDFASMARRAGLREDFLAAYLRASGLPVPERGTDADLRSARRLRRLLDAGLPEEAILEVARVAGQGISTTARAIENLAARLLLRPGDSELELGRRFADTADELLPYLGPLMEYQLRLHLREALRHAAIGRDERETGRPASSRDVAVAFADLVGFTRLGTRIHGEEVGRVAGRLLEIAYEVVDPPVTVVKTIGDAVMLQSPEVAALVDAALRLVAATDAEGADFPELRAGVAYGMAVPIGGDWYGEAVNLASRVTEVARRGTVLATAPVRREARDRFVWTRAFPRRFKGVGGTTALFRARPIAPPAAGDPAP